MNLLLALLLSAGALWLLYYFGRLLLAAAGMPTRGALERYLFQRRVERARQADQLLVQEQLDEGLRLLRGSFSLDVVKDLNLARAIANHHSGLLARLLSITADSQGGTVRLLSLAKVDRLLSERRELQHSYVAARQSPGNRHVQLNAELADNRRELESSLEQLINEVRSTAARPIYH